MNNVVNIHPPTVVENILSSLNKATDTEELYVLRAYINPETGERHLEWFTTACESRIWSVGALHYMAHKVLISDGGQWDDPAEGSM